MTPCSILFKDDWLTTVFFFQWLTHSSNLCKDDWFTAIFFPLTHSSILSKYDWLTALFCLNKIDSPQYFAPRRLTPRSILSKDNWLAAVLCPKKIDSLQYFALRRLDPVLTLTHTKKSSLIFLKSSEIIAFGPRSPKPLEYVWYNFSLPKYEMFSIFSFFNSAWIFDK